MRAIGRWFKQAFCDHDWTVSEVRESSSVFSVFVAPTSNVGRFRRYDQTRSCDRCGRCESQSWDNGALRRW